jgi:hypothetical protein
VSRRRAIPVTGRIGTTYLAHFDRKLAHAGHYAGWAKDLDARVADHLAGRGSRLLAAVNRAGIGWHISRTWPGTTNATEKKIKDSGHLPRYCPDCRKTPTPAATSIKEDRAMTDPPGKLAFEDAARIITAQYAAGTDLDQIRTRHDDVAATLAADARTTAGRAYARQYADTAATLIRDLREDAAVAAGKSAAACTLPDGTPHPDPFLAARGWQADRGIYQRTGRRQAEHEAAG